MKSIRIYYDGEINVELDIAIEDCLCNFGLTRWASGYDLTKDERDLAFETKETK